MGVRGRTVSWKLGKVERVSENLFLFFWIELVRFYIPKFDIILAKKQSSKLPMFSVLLCQSCVLGRKRN